MDNASILTCENNKPPVDFKRLPIELRRPAAQLKYAEAVRMYASTDLSIRAVAEKCGVTPSGLSAHIGQYHRELLFARYGLEINDESLRKLKVKPRKGQSLKTHLKYKGAIEACGDVAYIEYNVSQVARLFNLNGILLSSQLKAHYPDVIANRERLRQRLGIADNAHRGPRKKCIEAYAEALEMYRDTDMTKQEVARVCDVSQSGLIQFMRFYHKDIIARKAARRRAVRAESGAKKRGAFAGNGAHYGPRVETEAQYAAAMDLYRNTSMTIKEIVEITGVLDAGFRGYLQQWQGEERLIRRGYAWSGEGELDLRATKRFLKSTAAKYAPAIASLKDKPRHVAKVAAEFGLNAEVFRKYLKTHEPELAAALGMVRQGNGRLVKRASAEKYAAAIREYATTAEPLKSIAMRHGIVYNSIVGYMMRNCPEARASHKRILQSVQEGLPSAATS